MEKHSYILVSIQPEKYPNIEGLCADVKVSDIGKKIYINGDKKKIYRIEYKGVNKWVCKGELPTYGLFRDINISSRILADEDFTTLGQYKVKKCKTTNVFKNIQIKGGVLKVGSVIKVEENTDAWEIIEISTTHNEEWTFKTIFCDCDSAVKSAKNYHIRSCKNVNLHAKILGGSVKAGDFITVCDNPDTWEVIKEVLGFEKEFNITAHISNCEECSEVNGFTGNCREDGERTIAWATMVTLPEPTIPDKGFKDCCYENIVLADTGDGNPYKNDFTGFFFYKQMATDNCEFILHDLNTGDTYDLNNEIYGIYKGFNKIEDNKNLTTFIVEWQKVLKVLGSGAYQIEKKIEVAGFSNNVMSNTFNLKQYSNEVADKTVRIEGVMSGRLEHYGGVVFKNSDFKTSIRTKGFFGRREPKYKQDNLVKRNFKSVQITMSQENTYKYQTNKIPSCISEEILDFVLFSNIITISDYNLNNHSYKYRSHPVELKANKGLKYSTKNRGVIVNLDFIDKIKDKRKSNC